MRSTHNFGSGAALCHEDYESSLLFVPKARTCDENRRNSKPDLISRKRGRGQGPSYETNGSGAKTRASAGSGNGRSSVAPTPSARPMHSSTCARAVHRQQKCPFRQILPSCSCLQRSGAVRRSRQSGTDERKTRHANAPSENSAGRPRQCKTSLYGSMMRQKMRHLIWTNQKASRKDSHAVTYLGGSRFSARTQRPAAHETRARKRGGQLL
jgi:hypothetical protein